MAENEWVSPWWEPPLAGSDAEQLVGALDRLRTTFRYKVDELDADGLNTRIGKSSMTLGGLTKHLAANEDYMFNVKFRGLPIGGPWVENGWRDDNDWEFNSAVDNTPEELYALWDGAVERSRATLAAAIAEGGLDQPADISWPNGQHASLRRLVCDLIEEYGRPGRRGPAAGVEAGRREDQLTRIATPSQSQCRA
jgi:hypothetical protein